MKKILALIMALVLCISVFASCGGNNDGATLDEAKELLNSMMKDMNGKETPNDFDVVGTLKIGETDFSVTWKTNNENIKVVESSKEKMWTIDVPNVNAEEADYELTATIKAADDSTIDVTFTPKLPVIDNAGVVTEFEENVAYTIFMKQANLGYTVYALNTTQKGENKYIETTMDPKAAATFYVEVVDGGYKIHTEINGVKNYLHAEIKDGSKYIGFKADSTCVFTYDKELATFKITLNGTEYGVGTYNAFETISLSEATYFKADNINVAGGQFPIGFMTKEYADTLAPSEKPANNDPKADSTLSIADAIALGKTKAKSVYTEGKYYVEGTVKEIKSEQYGNLIITDGTNDLLIYGTYSEDGKTGYSKLAKKPAVGDKIKVYGIIGMYDEPQMKNGWITGAVAGEETTTTPDTPTTTSKSYINMVVSGTHVNAKYEATASTVYTIDATLKTIVANISGTTDGAKDGPMVFGIANDKTFTTMGPVVADASKSIIAQLYANSAVVEAPVAGTAYKLGMVQTNADNKTVYINGKMANTYYLDTSDDVTKGIDVYLEETTGGFYLYANIAIAAPDNSTSDDTTTNSDCTNHVDTNSDYVCDTNGCNVAVAPESALAAFSFGKNGEAAHVDGTTIGTDAKTYTSGSYTLTIAAGAEKVYDGAMDAKGNSCLKLGTGSAVSSFSFTVNDDVKTVVIRIAGYKAKTSKVIINDGEEKTLANKSDDGVYEDIIVDTTTNKTVKIATVSGATRAMINAIIYKA